MNDSSLPGPQSDVAPIAPARDPAAARALDPVMALPTGVFYALSEPRRDAWTRIVAGGDPGADAAAALAAAQSAQASGALNAPELFSRAADAIEASPAFIKIADGKQLAATIRTGEALPATQ